jgi:spore coat polysaccharide biosynthesis protein SpsF
LVKKTPFTLAILQARMSSSRLPGKVMLKLNGKPMIFHQIERIRQASTVDEVVVATSIDSSDDSLSDFLVENEIRVFRGSLNNVLSRFLEIQQILNPTGVIRLTGDCPLVMPELIDRMVHCFWDSNLDYLSNTLELTFPDGLDVEVFKPSTLEKLAKFDLSEQEKEHVTLGIYTRPSMFTLRNFRGETDLSQHRWTVDYLEDFDFIREIYSAFQGNESTFTMRDVLLLLSKNPKLSSETLPDSRKEN